MTACLSPALQDNSQKENIFWSSPYFSKKKNDLQRLATDLRSQITCIYNEWAFKPTVTIGGLTLDIWQFWMVSLQRQSQDSRKNLRWKALHQ